MSATLTLPARLDSPSSRKLESDLRSAMGSELKIDASGVIYCGTLALQLLLAARLQWQSDGQTFEMSAASSDLEDACRTLGIAPTEIGIQETTGEPK